MSYPAPDLALAKKLNVYATILSVVVTVFVISMGKIHELVAAQIGVPFDLSFLPAVYSVLNASAAICLVIALQRILKKDWRGHRQMIVTALALSATFLLLYILYHVFMPEVKYCGQGTIRTVYFTLLISHIVLAALSFPFILITFVRGYTMQVARHRAMSKYVYWIWLYVAVTGPIIYLILSQNPCK
jgi:putative membrane protein